MVRRGELLADEGGVAPDALLDDPRPLDDGGDELEALVAVLVVPVDEPAPEALGRGPAKVAPPSPPTLSSASAPALNGPPPSPSGR